ncbi:DUF924 family protein [Aliidiomarina soli]|uniref:DUF924 domain-containing protein n=1 Tax=Aliidiomarina soli TaxID=1928574 RepID=A0A432WE18_9GAMM|nr:DUF924 family protein [Aliidiomarina soli]RUO31119.1 DUF924 domain-containing protein [Aliidiomarina soli]
MAVPTQVLNFWFKELTPADWFSKSDSLDATIKERFTELHQQASRCELSHWRASAQGRLAEVILLDQFSRNMFRDTPQAFAQDALALALAQEAVANEADQAIPARQRAFLYMPYMHSESKLIHEEAVRLYKQPGLEENLEFEYKHKEIIDRFGRYPHRNKVLGRESTAEEIEFLQQPGSGF